MYSEPYTYTGDLIQLEASLAPHYGYLKHVKRVTTPLKAQNWEACLLHHPDPQFSAYIVSGF